VPSSRSESLTPTEHKAAELLVILAWRLESGSSSAPSSCWPSSAPSRPTTLPWPASCSCGKSRTDWHRCFDGRRSKSSTMLPPGSPANLGLPASSAAHVAMTVVVAYSPFSPAAAFYRPLRGVYITLRRRWAG
jgi:hypothetical protein